MTLRQYFFPAVVLCLPSAIQAESWYDGGYAALYRPDSLYTDHYACTAEYLGEHTGPTEITETTLTYHNKSCILSNPRSLPSNATEYSSTCTENNTETVEEISISRTDRGADINHKDYTESLLICDSAIDGSDDWIIRDEVESGDWELGFIENLVQMQTFNSADDYIIFSCRWNWKEAGIYVFIDDKMVVGPEVIFNIDGQQYPMTTEGTFADSINTGCETCKDRYRELWTAMTEGTQLTVIPTQGRSAEFSLIGSKVVLGDIPCVPTENPSAPSR